MMCKNCKDQLNNFTAIQKDIYINGIVSGWGTSTLFKECLTKACENSVGNTDLFWQEMNLISEEKKKEIKNA